MRAAAFIFLAATLATSVARAGDAPTKPTPEEVAALKARSEQIVASEPKAAGIFAVQSDGSVRHMQSGMVCPAKYPNVDFYEVLVYAATGTDVGCDYRRADDKGGASSKLTIFATKAKDGATLDEIFTRYESEIAQSSPNAKSLGPLIRQDSDKPASSFPELRSEEFVEPLNGTTYTSQLIVTLEAGWIIEIRATFVGLPNRIDVTKEGGVAAAVLAGGDRMMAPRAFFDAFGTIGH